MKCSCGRELLTGDLDNLCTECWNRKEREKGFDYNKPTKQGWVCPKCGYVWAIWVPGCENCNQPKQGVMQTNSNEWNQEKGLGG